MSREMLDQYSYPQKRFILKKIIYITLNNIKISTEIDSVCPDGNIDPNNINLMDKTFDAK